MTRKHSKKRDIILETIRSTKSHPSAQWVYEQARRQIPELSLGTVYRNLGQFLEEGAIMQVSVVNGEQRFDGTVQPHPHLVCERCNSVIDLGVQEGALLAPISFEEHVVDIRKSIHYGICGPCRAAESLQA